MTRTEDGKAAPANTTSHKKSWAEILDVDRPSLTELPPKAMTNPPMALKLAIGFYAFALVAMIVAIAVLKAPGA